MKFAFTCVAGKGPDVECSVSRRASPDGSHGAGFGQLPHRQNSTIEGRIKVCTAGTIAWQKSGPYDIAIADDASKYRFCQYVN